MRRTLLIAVILLLVLALPVAAQVYSTGEIETGRTFPILITGETTFVSFAPSQTGEFTVRARNFNTTPVVFILLGPDFQTLTSNVHGEEAEDGLTFRAIDGAVYHIVIAVVDTSDVGETLSMQLSFRRSLPQSEVRFFYGSDMIK